MKAIINAFKKPGRAYRLFRLRQQGVVLGSNCHISRNVLLDRGPYQEQLGSLQVGPFCQFEIGVILQAWGGHITLGENVFIGPYTVIYGHGGVTIGNNTMIAMHCCIVSSNHSMPEPGRLIRYEPNILLPTKIGDDVWLGAGVRVLAGVKIENGCIVGAGAVVASDLPAYSIAIGVPAKVVKFRK